VTEAADSAAAAEAGSAVKGLEAAAEAGSAAEGLEATEAAAKADLAAEAGEVAEAEVEEAAAAGAPGLRRRR
jgi:hypothetical protein